jgi:hypothetical protein
MKFHQEISFNLNYFFPFDLKKTSPRGRQKGYGIGILWQNIELKKCLRKRPFDLFNKQ